MPQTLTSQRPHVSVGIAELLAAYDDYPRLVRERDAARAKVEGALESAREAEDGRDDLVLQLEKEKAGRENDASRAVEHCKEAEKTVDKNVRAELDPKIKELQKQVADLTKDRSRLTDEVATLRRQMGGWISSLDRLRRERSDAATAEKKAEEQRMTLNTKLRDLDEEILQGLRKASVTNKVDSAATSLTEARKEKE